MKDHCNCQSNGNGESYSIDKHECVLTALVLVCVFVVRQASIQQSWAARHQLFQRYLLLKVADLCGSNKEAKLKLLLH